MRLVFHATALWEEDWLRYLLGDVVTEEIIDPSMTCFLDDSIHVVSSNVTPLASCRAYFEVLRSRCQHIILVHVSDELFSGGYSMYQYFDQVIRWNHSYLADVEGILTIPLGYPNGTSQTTRSAHDRPFIWSFVGQIKASRRAMLAAFKTLEPNFFFGTDSFFNPTGKKLSKAEFDAKLADSVFSPCPMGNTTIDTCRVYESLEHGAIPIVESRISLNYYANLFGPNPIPVFSSWPEARRFVEQTYADHSRLLALQSEVLGWWEQHKAKVSAEVRAAVLGPSHAAALRQYALKLRNQHTLIHQPLRMVELLRHQTGSSLAQRIAKPAVPLKRILTETLRRSK
jgi:hypothetical protein